MSVEFIMMENTQSPLPFLRVSGSHNYRLCCALTPVLHCLCSPLINTQTHKKKLMMSRSSAYDYDDHYFSSFDVVVVVLFGLYFT